MSGLLLSRCLGVLGIPLIVLVLGLCLFGDCAALKDSHILAPALAEIAAVVGDPGTQWMVVVCAGIYFLAFLVLRRRGESLAGDFWLLGLLAMAVVAYAFRYTEAVRSTQALTLIAAAMLGQAAGVWAEWRGQKLKTEMLKAERGEGEGRRKNAECRNKANGIVTALMVLLAGAAVWQAETGHLFQYRGQGRWTGPWDNPNTFGVLMGVGLVLAVGRMVSPKAEKLKTEKLKAEGEHPTSNVEHRTSNWRVWVRRVFFLGAAGVMGVGLVKSYSRGAWVGTAAGLLWLGYQSINHEIHETHETRLIKRASPFSCRSGISWFILLVVSLCVLGFWSFRQAELAAVRRAYSVANANDFSWRKRVAAYEGALEMMADKPWFGFGWNQPERVYTAFYCPAKVDEGMAIQLNDYLMLGMTLGLPALLCFVAYVGLALLPQSKIANRKSQMSAPCRAGALVLLVGFWFDGGLFKLATGATFWILLELGREGNHEIHEAHEND